eukprot:CAMPEP_0197465614 /NCGR_PEP_ID=MMETSP1175-20131217/64629_1 /TAXON_ID=1003142 /ORGANISM="Triceratium dubium, Strain CCMP147" /LENGTH=228 /DNA_ID=CAMNT_0043001633 /DNA_START=183 /DNA_END=869 /DNA_ORIENTATION=-
MTCNSDTTKTKTKSSFSSSATQKFWDGMAKKYSDQPIADVPSYEKKLEITRGYLRPDMNVVEIGCGTGGTSLLHAPYVKTIHATDISANMIDIARKKAEEEGVTNVTFERASVDELKKEDGSVDVVLGLSILHLLEDKEGAVRRVHGMLKPQGLFVTSTVCAADMGVGTKVLLNTVVRAGQFFGLLPNFGIFSKTELEESFKRNGFDIEYEWRPSRDKAAFIIAKKKT